MLVILQSSGPGIECRGCRGETLYAATIAAAHERWTVTRRAACTSEARIPASVVAYWRALRARWAAATEARRDAAARACQCGPRAAGLISGGSLRMTVHGRVCVDSATQPRGGGAMQRRDMRGLGHSWPCHCQCQCQASRIDLGGSRADETRRGEVPLPEPSMAAVTGQTGGLHLPQPR